MTLCSALNPLTIGKAHVDLHRLATGPDYFVLPLSGRVQGLSIKITMKQAYRMPSGQTNVAAPSILSAAKAPSVHAAGNKDQLIHQCRIHSDTASWS